MKIMKFNILLQEKNYCATFDTEYVHNFVPTINSFGPDIEPVYNLIIF